MCSVRSCLEQRDESNGHEVRPVYVGFVDIRPVLVGDVVVEVLLEFGGVGTFGGGLAGGDASVWGGRALARSSDGRGQDRGERGREEEIPLTRMSR